MKRSSAFGFKVALLALLGCSSSKDPAAENTGGSDGLILDDDGLGDSAGASSATDGPTCLGETRQAEAIGLDMYVMLDTSASMLNVLPGQGRRVVGETKWNAVLGSLESFLQAPETQDIGVGIQYFPLVRDDVPPACTSNVECGENDGLCSNSVCVQRTALDFTNDGQPPIDFLSLPPGDLLLCRSDEECTGPGQICRAVLGQCILPPGVDPDFPNGTGLDMDPDPNAVLAPFCTSNADCAEIQGSVCDPLGACDDGQGCNVSLGCPANAGVCGPPGFGCLNRTRCEAEAYSAPAVAIGAGQTHSLEIIASLRSRVPDGLTPTGPALAGALAHAQLWAEQNPNRQVVTVLATDGLPTECTPLEFPAISAQASAALGGARPVRTFVIGVFGLNELGANGQENLDALARAGGTDRAIIINTGADVAGEFSSALNRIRDTAVSCEFQLDNGAALNFDRVNLRVTDGAGNVSDLFNVGDASACGADDQGWYYVRDASGTPLQINVCPGTCATFMGGGGVRADLQVGCATRIR